MQAADNIGLLRKFQVKRPLTEFERQHQVKQKERLQVASLDQLQIIKSNSTYLECVDRYYTKKGWNVFLMFVVAMFGIAGTSLSLWIAFSDLSDIFYPSLILLPLALGLLIGSWWGFSKEARQYTHYPIRLNRRNRYVYVFRQDGTVLKANWNKLFFTTCRERTTVGVWLWDIRGHVLSDDKQTVLETFSFGFTDTWRDHVVGHWEFLRCYMEDGPEHAYKTVRYCMPVDGRRETPVQSWWRIRKEEDGLSFVVWFPMVFLAFLGRCLAMKLGKLPIWPPEVEAECAIDPADPFVKDARDNPPDLRVP